MKNILAYISGGASWLTGVELPSYNDDGIKDLRNVLGTSYKFNCDTLAKIYLSCPFINISTTEPYIPSCNYILCNNKTAEFISTASGPVSILPIEMPLDKSGPYPIELTIKYISEFSVLISYGSYSLQTKSNFKDGILYIEYPTNIDINGYIRLKDNWTQNSEIIIEVPGVYPVTSVDDNIKNLDSLYETLISAGTLEMFYSADTPYERIAVIIHTILLLTGYYE